MRLGIILLLLVSGFAAADIQTREIHYQADGVTLTGYIAWDDKKAKKPRPGVIVVHEWWGHNNYARKRAEDLARLGYVGFALDMYGDNKLAAHPADANGFMMEVLGNYELMHKRFAAAMSELKKQPQVDGERIAAIGYCFGGAVVLNMARANEDLRAVASFHGNLSPVVTPTGDIKPAILVANGADDGFVSAESIDAFRKEMEAANANYTFINYAGAKHGFSKPEATAAGKQFDIPLEYNEKVDKASWKELKRFLKKALK